MPVCLHVHTFVTLQRFIMLLPPEAMSVWYLVRDNLCMIDFKPHFHAFTQAIVCNSIPRKYIRGGYFLVIPKMIFFTKIEIEFFRVIFLMSTLRTAIE